MPGQAAGLHVHNGPVMRQHRGRIRRVPGRRRAGDVLRPGDVFYEPEGARITRFDAQAPA